ASMRMLKRAVFVLSCLVILPASASAQTALAGIVKDSSGGVLPGVTVEASSSSLIEKARSTVTDASGQYRLPELTPGIYTLTFSLSGFATVKRENIDVTTPERRSTRSTTSPRTAPRGCGRRRCSRRDLRAS